MLEIILQENGMTEKQALLYIAALEMGESTIAQLARHTHLKRTTVYTLLDDMSLQGFVSFSKRRGVVYVSPLPPKVLVDRFTRASRLAVEALPELVALAYASPVKPRMRLLEGKEGIKNALREFGNSAEPTMGFTDYRNMPRDVFAFIRSEVVPLRRKRNVTAKFLAPRNSLNEKVQTYDSSRCSEHRLIALEEGSESIEFLIYGSSSVAFLIFERHECFALILDSIAAHRMLKSIFQFMWNMSPPSA